MRKSVVRGWVLGLVTFWAGTAGAGPRERALADAAKEVYDLMTTPLKAGRAVSVEELCVWSKRWYAAEKLAATDDAARASAADEHLKRMQTIEQQSALMYKQGIAGPLELARAKYFVREAEHWKASKSASP